jgi:phospholipid/cholesterol/gamma-HCH transport system substrate-binding protein
MENKSHALAAGAFVLLATALLVALAVWLTRDSNAYRTYELSSAGAVSGLQPQAAVRFKGVKVGKVTAIGFDPLIPGNVLLRIAIDKQTPVTRSTFATLGFQGVTGLAFVQLDDGGESSAALPADTGPLARIPMRPSQLTRLTDQGADILTQLEETSRRVNQLLAPEHQQRLLGAIDNLSQAATSIRQLSTHADKMLPQLAQEADTTLKTMKLTSVRVGESADEARASARAFRIMTERMSAPGGTLDQLSTGVDVLASTGHTLQTATLPRVHRAVDDMTRAARQLGRAADTVSDNPQALILGNAQPPPGPGEPGFSALPGKP